MEQHITIETQRIDDRIILKVAGRIDSNTVEKFDQVLLAAKQESLYIDVNMSKVEFLSSMGIRSILLAYRQLKASNGVFRIVSPSNPVKNVIGLVNLRQMLAE